MQQEQEAFYARSGHTSPLGKCTAEVKSLIPDETKEQLQGLAFIAGVGISEYVRTVLMQHVHGYAHVIRLQHQRSIGMTGTGKD